MAIVISEDQDTVDIIAQRVFGKTDGVTEVILGLNPGISFNGVFLPAGLQVNVPDAPPKVKVRNVKRLWS